jgi:hypothetical protein
MSPPCVNSTVGALAAYLGGVFLGSALLAPWLYWFVEALAPRSPLLASLASKPFHRYVSRLLMVLALVGLWPLLRKLGLNSARDLGWRSPRTAWKETAQGFGFGFVSLALVTVVGLIAGGREIAFERGAEEWTRHLINAGLAAVLVATLEELLFRGALLGALSRTATWWLAASVSSGIYALVHFFKRTSSPPEVEWWTGLAVLGQMLGGFVALSDLVPGFATLFLAGAILAWSRRQYGHILFAVGLHAGWIFWLKSYGFVTRPVAGSSTAWWGTARLYDGWFAFAMVASLAAALSWLWRRPNTEARR